MLYILVILTSLMAGSAPAHADPVTAAIMGAAWVAANPILATVISTALTIAASVGAGLLAQALQKKPKVREPGVQIGVEVGDDQPLGFTFGESATAGIRRYAGTWGNSGKTPNAFFTDVIQIGDLPVDGLEGLWVNDEKATILWEGAIDRGAPVSQFRSGGEDHLWVRFHDGTQTIADSLLTSKFGGHSTRPWTSDAIGTGCPYVVITARYNRDLFQGVPRFLMEPGPTRWYDLRLDSTNGGSGLQRWSDPATWAATRNPAIIIYNIIRGVYYGGEWLFGGQNLAAFRLPASNWIAAANACDQAVALDAGGTEPAFRCGGEIRVDMEPADVIEDLLKVCQGRLAETGGIFKLQIGVPGAAVYAFTDDDIVVTAGQSFDPFPSLGNTHNAIEATYPERDERWSNHDAPARLDAALESEDGGRRLPAGVQFPFAPYRFQVQRLMHAMLEEERRFRSHGITLPPDAWALEPGDVVSWSSARNGYVDKKFIVARADGERTYNQPVVLKEIDPSDYDWSALFELPAPVGNLTTERPPPQAIVDWAAAPYTLTDPATAAARPAIHLLWDGDQDDVIAVRFQVRDAATGVVVHQGRTDEVAAGAVIISHNLLPGVLYEVRGRYVPGGPRETLWSSWLSVTTPDVRFGSVDILDAAVTELKIAAEAVTAAKLAVASVSTEKIVDTAIISAKLADAAVTNAKLVDAAVTAVKLASASVTTAKIADAAVESAKIASRTIAADRLLRKAITIEELVAGSFDNLIQNPGAEQSSTSISPHVAGSGGGTWGVITSGARSGAHAFQYNITGQTSQANLALNGSSFDINVHPHAAEGDQFYFDVWSRIIGTFDGNGTNAAAQMVFRDAAGGSLQFSTGTITSIVSGTYEKLSVTGTAPAGTAYVSFRIIVETGGTKNLRFDDCYARRMVAGAIIIDSAISTAKLDALAVTAEKVASSAVTTAKVAASAITTTEIAAGAVVTAKLAALAVTASEIASDAITSAKILAGAVTAVKLDAGSVTTDKLAANAVTAEKITANTITAAEISAAAIGTAQLAASAVTADKIAAKSIGTEKLFVGHFDNLIQNPGAELSTSSLVPHSANNSGGTWAVITSGARSGANAFHYNITGQTADASLDLNGPTGSKAANPEAAEGDQFYFAVWSRIIGTFDGNGTGALVSMVFRDSAGVALQFTNGPDTSIVSGTYEKLSVSGTAPAGTAWVSFRIFVRSGGTKQLRFDDCYARRMATGDIIVDGAITASKIAAGTITSSEIAAGTIAASNIAAGAITSSELAADSVIAGKISALAVTAGKIDANAVTATEIASGSVTTVKIAAGAVVADKIAADAVTSAKITAGAITAIKISTGAIETDKIILGGVTTTKIAVSAVTEVNAAAEVSSTLNNLAASPSWTDMASLSVTLAANEKVIVLVNVYGWARANGSGNRHGISQRVLRGGTVKETVAAVQSVTGGAVNGDEISFFPVRIIEDAPAAGTYVYKIQAQRTGGFANAPGEYTCSFVVLKAKR